MERTPGKLKDIEVSEKGNPLLKLKTGESYEVEIVEAGELRDHSVILVKFKEDTQGMEMSGIFEIPYQKPEDADPEYDSLLEEVKHGGPPEPEDLE